ncbi:hypothetical protein HYW44_04900 [Candidatus Daviesbacteria bacterium]|nr:hypothetical protein [Candidatus Daviesbacteria bacterium]
MKEKHLSGFWDSQEIADHLGAELNSKNIVFEGKLEHVNRIKLPGTDDTTLDLGTGTGEVRLLNKKNGVRIELWGLDATLTEDGISFTSRDENPTTLVIGRNGRIDLAIPPETPA